MAWYMNSRSEVVRCAYSALHGLRSYVVEPGEVFEGPGTYEWFFRYHGCLQVAPDGAAPPAPPVPAQPETSSSPASPALVPATAADTPASPAELGPAVSVPEGGRRRKKEPK